ncbi:MAG TPA: hypothetical protein VJQ06_11665 [Rhizomicrobium sp.]|nr:hypothetical protein [Rhizomicrobium sp.]
MGVCFIGLLLPLFHGSGIVDASGNKRFLNPADVARRQELSLKIPFVEGRISNPHNQAKNNLCALRAVPRLRASARQPLAIKGDAGSAIVYPPAQHAPVSVTVDDLEQPGTAGSGTK